MTINERVSDERVAKMLSETQAVITERNSHCVSGGSVEVNARLFENLLMEVQLLRHQSKSLRGELLVYAAPQVTSVPLAAEHQRVIQMLLNVCGAAFELADDSCQQEVDGDSCHVVPDEAFTKLSNALDEIEYTLPDEYDDDPQTLLQWAAIPRRALRAIICADEGKTTAPAVQAAPQTAAARDVLAERHRQVTAEGWTPEHDDAYQNSELADAAACYAIHAHNQGFSTPAHWPWAATWWKQSGARRDLVKAGALILAEIERIDRADSAAAVQADGEAK
ncbi:hypothetical protein NLZ15_17465 [Atlantibacter subterranea]|uniref:hypothetical protein n=1 Tax=Atlantibacter subterraneus TaxID=255519 RepID=UPI0020C1F056|nr:hypothetical protein [Atlantibacter subterranea]UTJ46611.1 hypothetical protein NLZ15_17465 [Atlantibacter subterranea]